MWRDHQTIKQKHLGKQTADEVQVWGVGRRLSDLASVISLTKDLKSLGWTGKRRTSMSGNRCRSEKERATEMETERTH